MFKVKENLNRNQILISTDENIFANKILSQTGGLVPQKQKSKTENFQMIHSKENFQSS